MDQARALTTKWIVTTVSASVLCGIQGTGRRSYRVHTSADRSARRSVELNMFNFSRSSGRPSCRVYSTHDRSAPSCKCEPTEIATEWRKSTFMLRKCLLTGRRKNATSWLLSSKSIQWYSTPTVNVMEKEDREISHSRSWQNNSPQAVRCASYSGNYDKPYSSYRCVCTCNGSERPSELYLGYFVFGETGSLMSCISSRRHLSKRLSYGAEPFFVHLFIDS
jgi:hypothetical protein